MASANPKRQVFRSNRLRQFARGQSCVLCQGTEGFSSTVVLAHLPGSFYRMPAGIGQKTHDWLGAHLCAEHHARMDSEWRRDSQMRLMALCLTLERLFDEGVITVTKRC